MRSLRKTARGSLKIKFGGFEREAVVLPLVDPVSKKALARTALLSGKWARGSCDLDQNRRPSRLKCLESHFAAWKAAPRELHQGPLALCGGDDKCPQECGHGGLKSPRHIRAKNGTMPEKLRIIAYAV
jgi:hypothetical protein